MIRRLLVASALLVGVTAAAAPPAHADDNRTICVALDPVLGVCQGAPTGLLRLVGDLLP